MIPPAYIIAALKKRADADEPLLPMEWTDDGYAHCIICQRPLAVLYWVNGNGPYCFEHKPALHC